MGADIADQLAPIPMSPTLGQTLTRAAQYAQEQSHAEVSLDHLLLALTEDEDARQVLAASAVDIAALQTDVSQQIGRMDPRLPSGDDATASISEELRRILNAAAVAARGGRRTSIDGAIVLAAIIGDAKTSAAGLLRAHGLTFDVAINIIREANRPQAAQTPEANTAIDALADARARVASRKVAGYSDTVARERSRQDFEQPETPRPDPSMEEGAVNDQQEGEQAERDASASEAVVEPNSQPASEPLVEAEEQFEVKADDDDTSSSEPAMSPPSRHSGGATPPRPPPPPAFRPPPKIELPNYAQSEPARSPPQLPSTATSRIGPAWAPPTGHPPQGGTQPPRGAPPPIPPAMPSRAPSRGQPGAPGAHPPPPKEAAASLNLPGRSPPWTGPPSGPPGAPPRGPEVERRPPRSQTASGTPLPSPEEVFSANARARQQTGHAPSPLLESHQPPATGAQPAISAGQLVENVPRRMRVGVSSPVEVRIAKAEVKAISEGLDIGASAHRHDIQVTKAMSVRLRAPEGGFFIETASPETQWIENALGLMADDYARWRWTVTPKARGKRRLQLIVSARTVGPDGLAAETALPDQIIEIRVSANYAVLAKRFVGWTIAAVLGGLLARFGGQIWTTIEPVVRSFIQP